MQVVHCIILCTYTVFSTEVCDLELLSPPYRKTPTGYVSHTSLRGSRARETAVEKYSSSLLYSVLYCTLYDVRQSDMGQTMEPVSNTFNRCKKYLIQNQKKKEIIALIELAVRKKNNN